jgi:hypothetical protein
MIGQRICPRPPLTSLNNARDSEAIKFREETGDAVLTDRIKQLPLMWTEALRALACMLPMLIASGLGKASFLVTLGQGGFFYSSVFLPKKLGGRLVLGILVVSLGLGFYLIGGAVAPNPWEALFFTLLVSLNLSFLSGWKLGGPLALTFIMIYTAGLNTGSPSKAVQNFALFALVMTWSAVISLLPFWKAVPPPPVNDGLGNGELAEQGARMGIGATIALAISYLAGFAKLGWAPSAVGNVVRFDSDLSRKRAWARFFGTIGGAVMASIALAFITSLTILVWVGAAFAILNGLFKKTLLGKMPLFYTATILVLYSANNLEGSRTTILQRVFYNIVGITIGMLVVIYPFPQLMRKLNPKVEST